MNSIMNKWENKCGYVSIEIVVVVSIILIGGLIGVTKYTSKGKETTNKTTNKVEQTVAFAGEIASGSGKNDGSGTSDSTNQIKPTTKSTLLSGPQFRAKLDSDNKTFTSIIFTYGNPSECSGTKYDVSEKQDGSIVGCLVNKTLTIKSEFQIMANSNCKDMFNGTDNKLSYVSTIKFDNFDTSHMENAFAMFDTLGYYADEVYLIGIENWDVHNLKIATWMFCGIGTESKKVVFDLSKWDVSNVTSMHKMFRRMAQNVEGEVSIGDISKWDISNVTDMEDMFSYFGSRSDNIYTGNLNKWKVKESVITKNAFFEMGTAFNYPIPKWAS